MSQDSNQESTALILEQSFNDETTHQKSSTANLGPRHEHDDTLYDAESEIESEEVEQKRNGTGSAREHQELQSFPSYAAAIEHMKTDFNNYHFRYTREQLYNLKSRFKNKQFSSNSVQSSLSDIIEWCEER